jgi:opacity protein-like surface antigen
MKKLLLASTALALLASPAHAGALRGSYASLEAGATWFHPEQVAQTITYTTTVPTLSELYEAEFTAGWAVLGSVGYAFESGMRAELEAGYRHNDLNRLVGLDFGATGDTFPAGGEFSSFTIMANAIYDVPVAKELTLSLGLGVGVEQAKLAIDELEFSDDTWQVAYQGLVGLNYNLSGRTQLFLNYRYLQTQRPEYPWLLDPVTNENRLTSVLNDLNRHTVSVGLRYGLGSIIPK